MTSHARRLRREDEKRAAAENLAFGRRMRGHKVKARDLAKCTSPAEIVKHLNQDPDSPATKRVSRFIQLFNRAIELNESFRLFFECREEMMAFLSHRSALAKFTGRPDEFSTGWTFEMPEMQALNSELNNVLTEINTLARRYRWHPFIRHMGFETSSFDITETWDGGGTEKAWETKAVWWLCGNRAKWIDYFRQCRECRRWFFACADHQSYCGDGCRKRHASGSEEFKEKRRSYMQSYRQREKELISRGKAIARKGR